MNETKETKDLGVILDTELDRLFDSLVLKKDTKVSPKGSGRPDPAMQKKMTVKVDFKGAKLRDILEHTMRNIVISQANSKLRPNYKTLPEGHVHEMKFIDLGVRAVVVQEDPYLGVIRRAKEMNMSVDEYMKYRAKELNA